MEAIHEISRLWVKAVALLRYQQGALARDEQPRSFLIVSGTARLREQREFDQVRVENSALVEAWPECLPQ
jgi:hypothetical protein